jgi:hypothetical protein
MNHLHKIQVLQQARHILETDRSSFICTAIQRATHDFREHPELVTAGWEMIRYVSQAIAPANVLEIWQSYNGIKGQGVLADRLAWIDWMIGHLKKPIQRGARLTTNKAITFPNGHGGRIVVSAGSEGVIVSLSNGQHVTYTVQFDVGVILVLPLNRLTQTADFTFL